MTPLRAQIVAARAYEAAWECEAFRQALALQRRDNGALALMHAAAHRRAAEIMEAEAAKEEGGSNA